MSDATSVLLDYIQSQIDNIPNIQSQAEKALNEVQGKDHVTKWKRRVIAGLASYVSPTYLQLITSEWLETDYFVGDVFDEITDDLDMCRRHLKKMLQGVQESGVP